MEFFSFSAWSSLARKILASSRSCTLRPERRDLSAYVGPMPRRVVPRALRPRRRSARKSSSMWYGRIRWALPDTFSRLQSMPRASHAVDLVEQHRRLDHDTVADDRHHVVVEHPRRQELEGEGLTVHDDRVAGVVAALVADDHGHLLGQQIGQLPLALVSPLRADDDGCRHWGSSRPPTGQPRDQSMVAARPSLGAGRARRWKRPDRRAGGWHAGRTGGTPEAAQVSDPGCARQALTV